MEVYSVCVRVSIWLTHRYGIAQNSGGRHLSVTVAVLGSGEFFGLSSEDTGDGLCLYAHTQEEKQKPKNG